MAKETYLDRLYIEYDELCVKLHKLTEFINSPKFEKLDIKNKLALVSQEVIMKSYVDILEVRILF